MAGRFTLLFAALAVALWAHQQRQGPGLDPAAALSSGDAAAEAQRLLAPNLELARKLLQDGGELRPFAAAITRDGAIRHLAGAAAGGGEDGATLPAGAVVALLERSLREGAATADYRAAAIVADVRMEVAGKRDPVSALQISLEHRAGYCVEVLYPYRRDPAEGTLALRAPLAASRQGRIFERCGAGTAPAGDAPRRSGSG